MKTEVTLGRMSCYKQAASAKQNLGLQVIFGISWSLCSMWMGVQSCPVRKGRDGSCSQKSGRNAAKLSAQPQCPFAEYRHLQVICFAKGDGCACWVSCRAAFTMTKAVKPKICTKKKKIMIIKKNKLEHWTHWERKERIRLGPRHSMCHNIFQGNLSIPKPSGSLRSIDC